MSKPEINLRKIVVLSGAGLSASSGLGTFRDMGGLWQQYGIEDVATPEAWERQPQVVLDFYNERRTKSCAAEPNAGHRAIAELERSFEVVVVTQNVDDLHERAGSTQIIHVHGELTKARSTADASFIIELGAKPIQVGDCCPLGGQLRPHIVWFGEEVMRLEEAEQHFRDAGKVLVVGTSLSVFPAAGWSSTRHGRRKRCSSTWARCKAPLGFTCCADLPIRYYRNWSRNGARETLRAECLSLLALGLIVPSCCVAFYARYNPSQGQASAALEARRGGGCLDCADDRLRTKRPAEAVLPRGAHDSAAGFCFAGSFAWGEDLSRLDVCGLGASRVSYPLALGPVDAAKCELALQRLLSKDAVMCAALGAKNRIIRPGKSVRVWREGRKQGVFVWAGFARKEMIGWWRKKGGEYVDVPAERFAERSDRDRQLRWDEIPSGLVVRGVVDPNDGQPLLKVVTRASTPEELARFEHARMPVVESPLYSAELLEQDNIAEAAGGSVQGELFT